MNMKKIVYTLLLLVGAVSAWSQYQATPARTWDKFPPEVQERGFGLHTSQRVQMDDEAGFEEVMLFCADNGHYPYFDIFRQYVVVADYYTKEVKYKSDIVRSTERILVVEDRNGDGKYEVYRKYFQNGDFTVDKKGNNLQVTWVYDSIECKKALHKK